MTDTLQVCSDLIIERQEKQIECLMEEVDLCRKEMEHKDEIIMQIQIEKQRMLKALQNCYRKHCLHEDSIGWEELSDQIDEIVSDVMGDEFTRWFETEEFSEWRSQYE